MYFLSLHSRLVNYATAKICESIENKEKVILRIVNVTVANITTLESPPPFLGYSGGP